MHLKHRRCLCPGRGVLLALALAGLWPAAVTAEPIRFSRRTGPATTQEFDRREPLLPSEARSGNKSGFRSELPMDTFMPPAQAMTPTTGLTRRQMEAQDQKRNWLLQSPEAILKQAERPDEANRNPLTRDDDVKSAAARFLEKPDATTDPGSKLKHETSSDKERRDRSPRHQDNSRDSQENSQAGRSADGRNLFDTRQTGASPAAEASGFFGTGPARSSSFSRMATEARERERQRENAASMENFQRNFNNPWAPTVTSGGNPLAGSASGLARPSGFPMNDLQRSGAGASLGPATRGQANLGGIGGQDGFDPKNPLNYGGPETVMQPTTTPRPTAAPIKLEAPRRKF